MGLLPFPDIRAIDFDGVHVGTWNNCLCQYQLTEGAVTSDTGRSLEGLAKSFVGFLTITQAGSTDCGLSTALKVFVIGYDDSGGISRGYLFIERKLGDGGFQTATVVCEFYDWQEPTEHITASNDYGGVDPENGVECTIDNLYYYPSSAGPTPANDA